MAMEPFRYFDTHGAQCHDTMLNYCNIYIGIVMCITDPLCMCVCVCVCMCMCVRGCVQVWVCVFGLGGFTNSTVHVME